MRTIGISFLVFCLTSGVFPFFKSPAAAGQKENSSKAAESKPEKAAAEKSTITVLATIILSASDLRIQLEGKKKGFQSAKTEEQKTKLKGEIEELNQKLGSFAKNFEKISTAVDLEAFAEEPEEVFDWKKEIQSIIGPIVQQIRGMTERPRRIEKLRMALARYESRHEPVKKALANIENLIAQAQDPKFKTQLKEKIQQDVAEAQKRQLEEKLSKEAALQIRKQLQEKYQKKLDERLKQESDETRRKALAQTLKKEMADNLDKELAQTLKTIPFKKELDQKVVENLSKKLASKKSKEDLEKRFTHELQALEKELATLHTNWKNEEQQISSQLVVTKLQLEEKLKQRTSLFESLQSIVRIFFKSRGKNLVFALLAFFSVILCMRLFYRLAYWLSPYQKESGRPFYVRLVDVIFKLLTVIGATSAFVIVLYISGDWVLLILAVIFLLGIAWTAKRGLPVFWEQIKLLLNLSTVRENERVVYNGIPWRVVSLNIYSRLENPALENAKIRLLASK